MPLCIAPLAFVRRPEEIIGEEIEQPERPAIKNKRVWASVRDDSKEVIDSAFEEATRRDPQHQRQWVVLVDGNSHQLETLKAAAKKNKVSLTIVLDFIHVLEYLWKAAHCFFAPGDREAEPWVMERALRLLQGKVRRCCSRYSTQCDAAKVIRVRPRECR